MISPLVAYYAALAGVIPIAVLSDPTCRETHLLRKLLVPAYVIPFTGAHSRTEAYILDLINGTTEMPNPEVCELNYWMNEWTKTM